MLEDASEVIRALIFFRDVFDPASGSVMQLGSHSDPIGRDPFRAGFLARIEEREELIRRLRRLDPRKRQIVCLWYMADLSAVDIARRVGVSRMHCYRLRGRALAELTRPQADAASA